MVGEKAPGQHRPGTKTSVSQRPRREWERVTAKRQDDLQVRATFRIDAPSPSQEVLARHDADLSEQPDTEDPSEHIICF